MMIAIYTLFNLICIIYGKKLFKSWFNPITLYAFVWEISIGLHESGFILYNNLSLYCWLVIFSLQTIFVESCIFGKKIKQNNKAINYDVNLSKNELKKYIIVTTCIAGIAIIGNLYTVISVYGSNLLGNLTNIYADRVYQTRKIETIPYIGSFIFIAMPLSGIYLKKFGFSFFVFPSFILAFANALTTGGRAGIVFDIILFGSAYFLTNGRSNINGNITLRDRKKEKRRKILLYLSVAALLTMVVLLSNSRNAGVTSAYASNLYQSIFGNNVLYYKLLEYLSSPVGVLNEYLENSELHFGENSFLPVFNLLSKFGIIERINQYQEFFATPIYSNVGTWFRELIEDFTYAGAIVVVFLFGTLTSYQYKKTKEKNSFSNIIVAAVLTMILTLTFFDWRFRTADTWITIIFGYIIGKQIDKKSSVGRFDG